MTAATQRQSGTTATTTADFNVDIMSRAIELAALLRMLSAAHEDLNDYLSQADVGWLLPMAARMADEIARAADEC